MRTNRKYGWREDLGKAVIARMTALATALNINQATHAAPRIGNGQAFLESQFPGMPGMDLIAHLVSPILPTAEQAGTYPAITRESILQTPDAKRGPGGTYNRVDFESEDKSYSTEDLGLEGKLPDDRRKFFASDFDAEMITTDGIRGLLMLAREIRLAAQIFNTSTWTGASLYTDVSSAAPWATISSDVLGTIVAAKAKVRALTGIQPDTLVIGPTNRDNLVKNTALRSALGANAQITEAAMLAALPAIIGLRKIFVSSAVKNAAVEGQTFSGSDVWAGYAMVCKTPDNPMNLNEPAVARTLLWTADSPEDPVVESYREEQTRSDVFRVRHNVDEVVVDASFGHLLKTV